MNCLMLMMGGTGTRFGADIPKQYIEVNGRPVFQYTLEQYNGCKEIDKVLIVSNPEWMDFTWKYAERILKKKLLAVVEGGSTRSHSVKNGLVCCEKYLKEDDYILIHDATNPFVAKGAIGKALRTAKETGAAVVGTNQYHTIYQREESGAIDCFLPREAIGSGYSPEIFRFSLIYPYYKNAKEQELSAMTSTVALVLGYGVKVRFVPADLVNLKITYPKDMEAFTALINGNYTVE